MNVKQAQGEDSLDFLKRVQSLSRNIEYFDSTDGDKNEALLKARTELALVLAVNGLKNQSLYKESIESNDLTLDKLYSILI